jgi:hypothetical protein
MRSGLYYAQCNILPTWYSILFQNAPLYEGRLLGKYRSNVGAFRGIASFRKVDAHRRLLSDW